VDGGGRVVGYRPVVSVNGVRLAVAPTDSACLSSGFGPRNGRLHRGVDYQGRPPGMVYAAGEGTVREAGYRDDFGFYVLIDHGSDTFTRYAHLQALTGAASVGRVTQMGTPLGKMGNSAGYRVPVHLHFELLVGDYDTPARSFGLEARDIFDYTR
jgi:murein DD-endopeptidase MepM/ murein hydrolase activator NlpD